VRLRGVSIVSLMIDGKERLCLAQISNTLLKNFSYNEIHNRRVALGITCVQVVSFSKHCVKFHVSRIIGLNIKFTETSHRKSIINK